MPVAVHPYAASAPTRHRVVPFPAWPIILLADSLSIGTERH
jgi:hypothetical protein